MKQPAGRAFHTQYGAYLKERTYARDDPQGAASRGEKPAGWWYAHERDRRVYYRLDRLYQQGWLFTFLTAKKRHHFRADHEPS